LFKIIEDKDFPDYEKYNALRNMFSHMPRYKRNTIESFLKYFNQDSFEYIRFEPQDMIIIIDTESEKTKDALHSIVMSFMRLTKEHIAIV
jgi:hypothetical protein